MSGYVRTGRVERLARQRPCHDCGKGFARATVGANKGRLVAERVTDDLGYERFVHVACADRLCPAPFKEDPVYDRGLACRRGGKDGAP